MKTCRIEAWNDCEEKVYSVSAEIVEEVLNALMEVFRSITVVDEEYGEILYQFYVAPQFFGESGSSKPLEDFLVKVFPKNFTVVKSKVKETDWQEFLKYLGEEN